MGRKALFSKTRGVAVTLLQRAFDLPPCNGLLPGKLMLQNLPSIVAAQALSPARGSRVLDMCAAPGGECIAPAQGAMLGGCMCCVAVIVLLGSKQVAAGVHSYTPPPPCTAGPLRSHSLRLSCLMLTSCNPSMSR